MLLLSTFVISSPTVPRILAILIGVVGIATAAGFMPVRAPQDFYGGLALVILATFALIASAELPGQRGFAFGPGTAPRLFAGLLVGARRWPLRWSASSRTGRAIEKYKIRGPSLVMLAIFLFAALIRPFGLIVATYLAFIVSIMGSKEMRWIESLIAAAAMTGVLRRCCSSICSICRSSCGRSRTRPILLLQSVPGHLQGDPG